MENTLRATEAAEQSQTGKFILAPYSTEALMLLVVLIWGTNYAIVKASFKQFSPLAFNAVRFILSSFLLYFIARSRGIDLRITRQEVLPIAGLSFLYITLYQIFFIEGIARTTTSNSAMILAATPALVTVANHFAGGERMNTPMVVGVTLAFLGLYGVIAGGNGKFSLAGSNVWGDVLTLGSVLCWSAYTVLARPHLKRFSPLKLTVLSNMFGTLPMLLWSLPAMQAQDWRAIDFNGWLGACYSGVFSIAVSYIIWNFSLAKIGANKTAIYSNVVPVVAVLTGVLFLNEHMSHMQILGAICVIAGIVLARWRMY